MSGLTMRRELTAFYMDPDVLEALRRLKAETGAPIGETVRRAVRAWLEGRGHLKADRKRAATRKRS